MDIGYHGGILRYAQSGQRQTPADADWSWTSDKAELFLRARGGHCKLFTFGPRALLIRGYVVSGASGRLSEPAAVAGRLHRTYQETGTLAIDGLEGNFTLALLDGEANRLLLYRNLIGTGYTYYHETPGGLLFGSNLPALVEAAGREPRVNEAVLPAFFLHRNVPGRYTLFDGFCRMMPGEQLLCEGGAMSLTQRATLGGLREGKPIGRDALDRLEETMGRILADYAVLAPDAANLLSGGVDSSFLQAHWNRTRPREDGPPRSYCVTVDHPRTRPDAEYALSASDRLGTHHVTVPADEPYAAYLLDTLASTGEAPNHVQVAYYPHLARNMAADGVTAALCAETADSLFGLPSATRVQNAALLRRLFPMRPLRRLGAVAATLLRRDRLRGYFDLADCLHDQERLAHPVNKASVFADWPSVETCFGVAALERHFAARRMLLDLHGIPSSPLERMHGATFLGSSMNTASLTATLFNNAGPALYCPFLDSRMLRLVMNLSPRARFRFRRPKEVLRRSLTRHGLADLAYRSKLGFGQPIFEWLAPGGALRPLVEQIDAYEFLDRAAFHRSLEKPNWFLYSLLCYDLWHKLFIRRTLPRSPEGLTEHLTALTH